VSLLAPAAAVRGAAMGWQTMLADLSLILFMVSAAAMADGPVKTPPPAAPKPVGALARSEPLAVWRDAPGAPALGVWLAGQQADARQQLTITLRYRPADQAAALERAAALAREAGKVAGHARIILEPVERAGAGGGVEALATLAYDRDG